MPVKLYTKKDPLDHSVKLETIAALCNGYVGADLEALCREATMCALKRSSNKNNICRSQMDYWKSARSIVGPSITRGVTVEIPKVSWDDIGGLHDLKVGLLEHIASSCRKSLAAVAVRLHSFDLEAQSISLLRRQAPPDHRSSRPARALHSKSPIDFSAASTPSLQST
ncbi:hypothetical protein L2E82_39959 [Cichorium intybus]|uniref:Uncharacterized protein n=1 Tax=Cichorium intybus TaxID=13427 RepID=A0ACB9AP22_CICIN|nr:hypothetical protein L2E82_39959 [Cichorium intybus]